jgi:hypothetical protein
MKMADAGFRPAYNVQVVSTASEQIVVTVEVGNNGSDRGLMRPMLERLRVLRGHLPRRHLVDGGFCSGEDIEWAHGEGVEVYCPPTQSKSGVDPCLPRRGAARGCWLGGPGGEAKQAGRSTKPVRSANASMPAGATGTCGSCPCVASTKSAPSYSGMR